MQLDKSRKNQYGAEPAGLHRDEALNEVDKFLDSGMLRGQSTLYIIHGNGTGALRTAIQKHLRTHKAVKSFRLGRYGEGESGVTVVELSKNQNNPRVLSMAIARRVCYANSIMIIVQ